MANDNSSIPKIPSWQRATSQQPSGHQAVASPPREPPKSSDQTPTEESGPPEEYLSPDAEGSSPSVSHQLDQIDALLDDPDVKVAPAESRALPTARPPVSNPFPARPLTQSSTTTTTTTTTTAMFDDFDAFKQSQSAPVQSQPLPSVSSPPPPIITYPEFLVDARVAPPLITPERLLNATYAVGSIAALAYGASQFLIAPMVESLTASRQDFAAHTRGKVDEFNERLSRLVSKLPETSDQTEPPSRDADDITSDDERDEDPTELYSRSFGTQTSPPQSRRASMSAAAEPKTSTVDAQTDTMQKIRARVEEIANGLDGTVNGGRERQESLNKLQGYLDTLIYASPAINLWTVAEDSSVSKTGNGRDDVVEQVKKEIRGVKGLLLNARRFPSTPLSRIGA